MSTIANAFAERAQRGTGDVEFEVEVSLVPPPPTNLVYDTCTATLLKHVAIELDRGQTLVLFRGTVVQQVDEPVPRDMQTLEDTARDLLHDRLKELQKQGTIHEFNIGDSIQVRWD